jgi:hypothetical protein
VLLLPSKRCPRSASTTRDRHRKITRDWRVALTKGYAVWYAMAVDAPSALFSALRLIAQHSYNKRLLELTEPQLVDVRHCVDTPV